METLRDRHFKTFNYNGAEYVKNDIHIFIHEDEDRLDTYSFNNRRLRTTADLLSVVFSHKVIEYLTDDELAKVIEENDEHPDYCATHKFMDANMVMDEAFQITFGREFDMERDEDHDMWNEAWSISKKNRFK